MVLARVELARTSRSPCQVTYRIRRADDGRESWLEGAGTFRYDADGVAVRMVGVVRDITQARRAQEALRQSAMRLQAFIDAAPVMTAMFDRSMRYLAVSERFAEHYRLDRRRLIGCGHYDLFPQTPEWWREVHRRCLLGSSESSEGDAFAHPDGSVCWVRWAIQPWREEGGETGGIVLFIEDITQRRRTEAALARSREWFALALSIGELGTWDWDLCSNRVVWNEQHFRILGYAEMTDEPVEVTRWSDRIHSDDRPMVIEALHKAAIHHTPFRVQYRIHRADTGEIAWLEDAGMNFYDQNGDAIRMVGILRDITQAKQAQEALRASTIRLRTFIETAPVSMAMVDRGMRYLAASQRYGAAHGIVSQDLIGRCHYEVFPDMPERWRGVHRRCLEGATERCACDSFERSDGSTLWLRWEIRPWRDEQGDIGGLILFSEDITESKVAEDALFREKERAQVTLHSIGEAVITTDKDGRVDYLNPAAEDLTGWSSAAAFGLPLNQMFDFLNEADRSPVADIAPCCCGIAARQSPTPRDAILVSRDGTERIVSNTTAAIRDRDGSLLGSVVVFRDVTETRRLARQLEHDASHDLLTGLPNRRAFEIRLARAVETARAHALEHAVCILDLDQFKVVNDSAGHPAGDALLRQIPSLLAGKLREYDTLARIGGDEFAVLLENCSLDEATRIARRMVTTFDDWRFSWSGRPYQVGASVGVVAVTGDAGDAGEVLAKADVACYAAKEAGRNGINVYQAEDSSSSSHHAQLRIAGRLNEALEQERFRLFCQPIIALLPDDAHRPQRFEVLIRMLDDEQGLMLPGQFIPAAERYGMMASIDRWVVQSAFRQYLRYGRPQQRTEMSINLSGVALGREDFTDFVLAQFVETGMPADRVCFEITETAAIQRFEQATHFAERIRAIGGRIALDDFGSGLSSFKYLRHLPTDYLKIDGAFVRNMLDNHKDQAMVAAINDIGHQLGLATVAEYVDKLALVPALRALGVDYAQGYALGLPVPFETAFEAAAA